MSFTIPAIVCVVGALIFSFSMHPKISRMGEIAYFVGLMWLVYTSMSHALHF